MDMQWEYDKFHEDSYGKICYFFAVFWIWILYWIKKTDLAKNVEIKKFENFLQTYAKELSSIEETLSQVPLNTWDYDVDILDLDVCWVILILKIE